MNENYVRIGGGLTRDPTLTSTRYGSSMVGLTVAVNGTKWDGEQRQQVVTTQFVSVLAFGVVAERIVQMGLGRGDTVVVEGSLSQEEVEGDDGKKDRKTRVQAWNVVLVHSTRTTTARPISRQERPQPPGEAPPKDDPWAHGDAPGWGPPPDPNEPPF